MGACLGETVSRTQGTRFSLHQHVQYPNGFAALPTIGCGASCAGCMPEGSEGKTAALGRPLIEFGNPHT